MHVFKTERTNQYLYFAKRLFITLIIYSIPILCSIIFKRQLSVSNYCVIISFPLLMQISKEVNEERIREIVINNDYSITYTFKKLFSSPQIATLSPGSLRIEISNGLSKTLFKKRTALTFLDNGKEKFRLSRYKDGFSVDSLKQICASYIETPVPILR